MKPVAIIQHEADVSAGTFEQFLNDHRLPAVTIRVDRGETLPASAEPYSGICSLGGSVSVNDRLPWIEPELALLRDADARGRPLIGHCLGGQLIARAFGGAVGPASFQEIGWADVTIDDQPFASEWLGAPTRSVEVFHWHGDIFELPPSARHLMSSALCEQQAFVIERSDHARDYAHLGMQFHIEMTPELVRSWVREPRADIEIDPELRDAGGPAVQSPAEMLIDLEPRAARMRVAAFRLYQWWARGLARA